jgi:hypothetical protein
VGGDKKSKELLLASETAHKPDYCNLNELDGAEIDPKTTFEGNYFYELHRRRTVQRLGSRMNHLQTRQMAVFEPVAEP